MSVCVIEYLEKTIKKKAGWEPRHVVHRKSEIVSACGIQVALYLDELLQIMAGAFKVRRRRQGKRACGGLHEGAPCAFATTPA